MSAAHFVIGKSVEARDIACWKTSAEADSGRTLIVGGIHGDEPATVALLEEYRVRVPAGCAVAILPLANPDGLHRRSRYNARGVDLNRNCGRNWRADSIEPSGPAPWSEPESRALRDFIESWRPAKIVSLHWALAEIDADGLHSTALAAAMWRAMTDEQRRPYRPQG